jgi:hypothetical protein
MSLLLFWISKHPQPDGLNPVYSTLAAGAVILSTALAWGPLWMCTTLATIIAAGYSLGMRRGQRFLPLILACLSILVPYVLEVIHVLPGTTTADGETFRVVIPMLQASPRDVHVIAMADVLSIAILCFFALRAREKIDEAQRREHITMWQVRQLLPRVAVPEAPPGTRSID